MSKIRTVFGLLAALAAALWSGPVAAQSNCQYIAPNAVLTAGQWNSCFAAKQDAIGFTPINPGNIAGIAPIGFNLVSGVYQISLATDSNFAVNGSNQLALASAVKITTSLTVPTIYGGTAANASLSLLASSNVSPSGDTILIQSNGITLRSFSGTTTINIGVNGSTNGVLAIAASVNGVQNLGVSGTASGGTATLPVGNYTLSGTQLNETFSGLKIFTGGATGSPTNGQASFGGNTTSGAVLIGNGSTNDFSLQNSANSTVCTVVHATTALSCASLTLTSPLAIAQGGTGQITASAAIAALMPTPTRAGDVAYWNGSIWTTLAGNNSGTQILTENSSGVPSWAASGSVSSVAITGAGGTVTSGTCTITTSGTCAVDSPGGFLNVLRNASFSAWFHGCVASACTISPQFSVTGAVSNAGACEITISSTATFTTGELVPVYGIAGATGCNGTWIVTVTNGTQLTLQGTTFGGAYTSGGTAGGGYCMEEVFVIPTGAAVTCTRLGSQANGAPLYSMEVLGATSVTDMTLRFIIESYISATLSAQTTTFSMRWVNNTGSSVTPTIQTKYTTGSADNWPTATIDLAATNMSACSNGAACTEAYTFSFSNNAVLGYEINIDFGNNFSASGKNMTLLSFDARVTPSVSTGINSNIPPFEVRDPESDIRWSERFYQMTYDNNVEVGTATHVGITGFMTSASAATNANAVQFRTTMRCDPPIQIWDGAGNANKASYYNAGWTDNNSGPTLIPGAAGNRGFPYNTISGGTNPTAFHWAADCSLFGG